MSNEFYITTPIYYVNDKPHIGHSYTTILADVLARYNRLLGRPVYFLTGTDEHGQKVQQAAAKNGITPQEHVDTTVVRFQEAWKHLDISHNDFIRTTQKRHTDVVRKILQDLYDRDEIYKAEYDGWYCVTCERFYTEKDLVDGNCPAEGCGRAVEPIKEANYFFRMSNYQEWLVSYIEEHPQFIQPDFRRNETLGFLKNKLNDLCISRPKKRLSWGIELPFDTDYVTYVWFDALVNYISGVGYLADDEMFKKWWPASYHLIGKDILTTHTVYWPTMLKAMGVEMPKTIFAHGWWMTGGARMSKSAGNVVNPMDFAEQYGIDPFRYHLMAEMSLGKDTDFTEESFVKRYNSMLANDLGNSLNRVMKLVASHCDSRIPEAAEPGDDEEALRKTVTGSAGKLELLLDQLKLDAALEEIAGIVRTLNRYLEKREPWKLAKKDGETGSLHTVLYTAAETLRIISGLLHPVMPGKMTDLRTALGISGKAADLKSLLEWGGLKPGTAIGKMEALFPRIDVKKLKSTAKPAPKKEPQEKKKKQDDGLITYDQFRTVQLRTATILEAERVEGTDKLMKLKIKVGGEERPLVAGVALHYTAEDLIGKEIVVVANLKPAKIRGNVSQGMLLAAVTDDGTMAILSPDKKVGSGIEVS